MSSFWDQAELHNQYLASLASSFGGLAVGASVGWSAPAQQFLVLEGQFGQSVSFLQFSWISGALWLGFAIPLGLLAKRFGPKLILFLIVGVVNLAGWFVLIYASNLYWLSLARFLQGLAAGTFFIVTPLYNTEISKKNTYKIGGRCLHEVFYALGMLYAFVLGNSRKYQTLCYGCLSLPLLFLMIFMWMPETPVYYITRGQTQKAASSIRWLRGKRYNMTLELANLEREVAQQRNDSEGFFTALKHCRTLKFLLIGLSLVFLQHFTGATMVISYASYLFRATGAAHFDPLLCTAGLGLSIVLGVLIAIFLLNVLEPRILLILSCILVIMLTAALGVHSKLRKDGDPFLGHLTWLSVVGLWTFMFSRALGLGTLIYYFMSKMLRNEVRNFGIGFIYSMSGIFGFLNVKFFPNILAAWNQQIIFFFYTGIGILGLFFIYISLPEIQKRTTMDIQMTQPLDRASSHGIIVKKQVY